MARWSQTIVVNEKSWNEREDRIEALEAETERLRAALRRARDQITEQQAMPDPPTWIDDILTSASQ